MTVSKQLRAIFSAEGLTEVGFLPYEKADICNQRLHDELTEKHLRTVIIFLLPYFSRYKVEDTLVVSKYARTYDYHREYAALFDRLLPLLQQAFPQNDFHCFADHSPISEKTTAARASLGVIGRNTLLINPTYGSYVYLGSILTDLVPESFTERAIAGCIDCGGCERACPGGAITKDGFDYTKCLSFVSQKKQQTPEERAILKEKRIVWGCDACQDCCPMNRGIQETPFPYFHEHLLTHVTADSIESMPEEEFQHYPFSWRPRRVILDNIRAVEEADAEMHT